MSQRTHWSGKALGLVIAWMLVLGGVVALLAASSVPSLAATCDQGGSLITGTWNINTVQVCSGILYTVDGSVNVGAGGSLTILNGGLNFAKDVRHEGWALNVTGGGSLILDNSIVTTQTGAIQPYLFLALTVTGPGSSLTMKNGAVLKFPGTFTASSATITMTGSTVTGFTAADLGGVGLYPDSNDDSPVISWSATNAFLYKSRVERIDENSTTGAWGGNVSILGGSNLYAYDSYVGVDYSNVQGLHNELQVDAASNAYLYNVTIDRLQDPVLESNWQPAYMPLGASATGGAIYLLRWARVSVVDSTGFPVSGASIWSRISPAGLTAQYPDTSPALGTTPTSATLAYLGRDPTGSNAWNVSDPNGQAIIPVYTDVVTTSSLPNANSFGNYQFVATFGTYTATAGVNFPPYPMIAASDNSKPVTAAFAGLSIRTGPDLALHQSDYRTRNELQNQPFTIYAIIYNQGQTSASGVSIAAYLDGNRTASVARVDNLNVAAGANINQSLNIPGIATVATHTVELVVDPDNKINEGGIAQESNNFANVTVQILPPPAGFASILGPAKGATIDPGTKITVTGYLRDTATNGISGVGVTIDLKYGSSQIATNTTKSGTDGFFAATVTVPADATEGQYTIVVTPGASVIQPDQVTINVLKPVSFINSPVPLLGIPWWMFLIILAAVVAALVGVTLYFKVFGLGKMVECGECGAFIPEDATTCPKCGVEFEKDMAKCSNCQAWIPVDVKECPECGVEFATGELDMTDYQAKMRLQYDEVVQKFQAAAQNQLGRSLTAQEFQEWWRKQPTFVTFEDWLREEEEMRKQGSKPCPVCGTLNSVTAKVCHKCGSMMKEPTQRPPTGGTTPMAPKVRAARAPATEEGEEPQAPPPRRPPSTGASPVVVQKKVVKRFPPEGEQSQGGQQQAQGESGQQDEDL